LISAAGVRMKKTMVIPWLKNNNFPRQNMPQKTYIKRPWVIAAHDLYSQLSMKTG
jgi:hypothetical protein